MKHLYKFKLSLMLFIAVCAIAGCKVYKNVSSNYDKTIDFSKYKTFAWLPDTDTSKSEYNNQIIRNNTRNYFTHAFGDINYKADIENPDILLELVITETKKHTTITSGNTSSYPYVYQNNPYYYPYPNSYYYRNYNNSNYSNSYTTQKVEYTEGSITLNVIDRKLNQLVWTGTAKGDLYDANSIDKNLHPAVYDIMKRYSDTINKKIKRKDRNIKY